MTDDSDDWIEKLNLLEDRTNEPVLKQSDLMIAQDKLFGLASQHTSILAGHTKKLKEIEEWWPAEQKEGMQTRMVETDKLVVQASKAQAEWSTAAEIARTP